MVVRRGRHPKRLQRTRRAVLRLTPRAFVKCAQCGTEKMPHRVCKNCGSYRGNEIINVLAKLEKKERKKKEKQLESEKQAQAQTQSEPLDAKEMSKPQSKKEPVAKKRSAKEKRHEQSPLPQKSSA